MKTLTCLLLIFSLVSCQKEIQFLKDPKTGQVPKPIPQPIPDPEPEPQSQDTIYREEPTQVLLMREFSPMLWEYRQYKLTEYYCVKRNLWDELSPWLKDDVFTFHETGTVWVNSGTVQHPVNSFDTIRRPTQIYAQSDAMKLDLVDENYKSKAYSIVAYKAEESFTLCSLANDSSKVFLTFSYLGKQ